MRIRKIVKSVKTSRHTSRQHDKADATDEHIGVPHDEKQVVLAHQRPNYLGKQSISDALYLLRAYLDFVDSPSPRSVDYRHDDTPIRLNDEMVDSPRQKSRCSD